jgi:hypothetical protein
MVRAMIRITKSISIDENELTEKFVRASARGTERQ